MARSLEVCGDSSVLLNSFSLPLSCCALTFLLHACRILTLNRSFRDSYLKRDDFWRVMCDQLSEDALVHVPEVLCAPTWRDMFSHLYTSKDVFQAPPVAGDTDAAGPAAPVSIAGNCREIRSSLALIRVSKLC